MKNLQKEVIMENKFWDEKECPVCGALVTLNGAERYALIECHECGADLELVAGGLIEACK